MSRRPAAQRPPFEPLGVMSVRAACEQIIRGLEPDDGITFVECIEEVQRLTEVDDVSEANVRQGMRVASEDLLAGGEPGVRTARRYGWVRMTDSKIVIHAEEREKRAVRQRRRAVIAATAAKPEKLSWEERQTRDYLISTGRRETELAGRRSKRLRPLPPAAGDT